MSHNLIHQDMKFKHTEVRNRMVVIRVDQHVGRVGQMFINENKISLRKSKFKRFIAQQGKYFSLQFSRQKFLRNLI